MKNTSWISGDWIALCDQCGFKFKASQLKRRWDGYMVCQEDWEMRHPQELIRPIPDQKVLPWTRPDPFAGSTPTTDNFIFVCTVVTSQGAADYGTADCARADINFGYTNSVQTTEG